MMRLHLPQEAPDDGDEWLASFSDLIVLVLCFFVVLTAIFAIKESEAFEAAIGSLKGLGKDAVQTNPSPKQQAINATWGALEAFAENNPYRQSVQVSRDADKVYVEFNEKVVTLFPPGSANLTIDAQYLLLEAVRRTLFPASSLQNTSTAIAEAITQIDIQGHTDSLPPGENSAYPTNWEISLVRANNVRRFLEYIGFPEALLRKTRVSGHADNQPAVQPETVSGNPDLTRRNRAMNRRVVIVLHLDRS